MPRSEQIAEHEVGDLFGFFWFFRQHERLCGVRMFAISGWNGKWVVIQNVRVAQQDQMSEGIGW